MNNTSVESYLAEGCGRCDRFQTPECKVHTWAELLVALRAMMLETGLDEQMKWGSPCYALDGKNVIMLSTLNDAALLSFFKGAALTDEHGLLEKPGPNSHYGRYLKFRSMADLTSRREQVNGLVANAIELERAGVEIAPPTEREPMPAELEARLSTDDALRQAFEALTPGRQRSFILHVGSAKQAATRERRV